jgi:hypothetical protein
LLARKVLQRQTIGYKNHPQLDRFKAYLQPVAVINCYLYYVYEEAVRRGYNFDAGKLGAKQRCSKIPVTDRQLRYELNYLKTKLKLSDVKRYQEILAVKKPKARPLFKIVEGGIEVCERR